MPLPDFLTQLLGEFRFTSIPVRTLDGRMDKMIDIYDISTSASLSTGSKSTLMPTAARQSPIC